MVALDGNAIGGLLLEVFGTDMTDAEATCAACGATGPVAETVVYLRGPGTVVRCRNCSGTLMVISQIRGHELRRPRRPDRARSRRGWLLAPNVCARLSRLDDVNARGNRERAAYGPDGP